MARIRATDPSTLSISDSEFPDMKEEAAAREGCAARLFDRQLYCMNLGGAQAEAGARLPEMPEVFRGDCPSADRPGKPTLLSLYDR
jgi:hypothetical protein